MLDFELGMKKSEQEESKKHQEHTKPNPRTELRKGNEESRLTERQVDPAIDQHLFQDRFRYLNPAIFVTSNA